MLISLKHVQKKKTALWEVVSMDEGKTSLLVISNPVSRRCKAVSSENNVSMHTPHILCVYSCAYSGHTQYILCTFSTHSSLLH